MRLLNPIKSVCANLAPNCRQASLAQSKALEKPLPFSQRVGLWLHLMLCGLCRRYGRQIRLLHTASHQHGEKLAEAAPKKLSSEARERLKQRLQKGA